MALEAKFAFWLLITAATLGLWRWLYDRSIRWWHAFPVAFVSAALAGVVCLAPDIEPVPFAIFLVADGFFTTMVLWIAGSSLAQ
jgi:hypothetical protein